MGRASRPSGQKNNGSGLRGEAHDMNDYVDFDTYAQYSVASEYISTYDASKGGAGITAEEHELAISTIRGLETGEQTPENVSMQGIQTAEKIYTDMARGGDDETLISEHMDPDREFLFQSDSDHLLTLAEHMRSLQGTNVGNRPAPSASIQDAHREHEAARREQAAVDADAARDTARENSL